MEDEGSSQHNTLHLTWVKTWPFYHLPLHHRSHATQILLTSDMAIAETLWNTRALRSSHRFHAARTINESNAGLLSFGTRFLEDSHHAMKEAPMPGEVFCQPHCRSNVLRINNYRLIIGMPVEPNYKVGPLAPWWTMHSTPSLTAAVCCSGSLCPNRSPVRNCRAPFTLPCTCIKGDKERSIKIQIHLS
jgi:hypothetical protein